MPLLCRIIIVNQSVPQKHLPVATLLFKDFPLPFLGLFPLLWIIAVTKCRIPLQRPRPCPGILRKFFQYRSDLSLYGGVVIILVAIVERRHRPDVFLGQSPKLVMGEIVAV